jgi:hypothetical protein
MVSSFRRFELLDKAEQSARPTIHQPRTDFLYQPALQVGDLLRGSWECEYLDGFEI